MAKKAKKVRGIIGRIRKAEEDLEKKPKAEKPSSGFRRGCICPAGDPLDPTKPRARASIQRGLGLVSKAFEMEEEENRTPSAKKVVPGKKKKLPHFMDEIAGAEEAERKAREEGDEGPDPGLKPEKEMGGGGSATGPEPTAEEKRLAEGAEEKKEAGPEPGTFKTGTAAGLDVDEPIQKTLFGDYDIIVNELELTEKNTQKEIDHLYDRARKIQEEIDDLTERLETVHLANALAKKLGKEDQAAKDLEADTDLDASVKRLCEQPAPGTPESAHEIWREFFQSKTKKNLIDLAKEVGGFSQGLRRLKKAEIIDTFMKLGDSTMADVLKVAEAPQALPLPPAEDPPK